MRDRSLLSVIEQVVMVLVFALAAALCLRAFVLADQTSRTCEARDRAVLAAQSAAETVKHCGGDLARVADILGGTVGDGSLTVGYDAGWQTTADDAAFVLTVQCEDSGSEYLGCAAVSVCDADGVELFRLDVCWQEGVRHG